MIVPYCSVLHQFSPPSLSHALTHQMRFATWDYHLVCPSCHPQRYYDTDGLQLLVEHRLASWSVILGSSRESESYQDAFSTLLSSDYQQKLLYSLSDRSAIEGMLNALDLVNLTHARITARADPRNVSTQRSRR